MKRTKLVSCIAALVFFSSLAFAEEQIIVTTYYPSPYGSYRDLDTQTLLHRPQARSTIEGRFHCTDGLAGNPNPNPACTGLMYFDAGSVSGSETIPPGIYFFDGASWNQLGGIDTEQGFDIGGYKKDNVHNSNYIAGDKTTDANKSFYVYLTNASLIDLSDTVPVGGSSANQLYGTPASGRVALYTRSGLTDAAVRINYRNFPAGNYQLSWQGDADVDQYLNITRVRRTNNNPENLDSVTNAAEYQEAVDIALGKIKNAPIACNMYLQRLGDGWANLDYSENLYDNNGTDGVDINTDSADSDGGSWSIPLNYTSYQIRRAPIKFYNKASATKDVFRYYRIVFYKRGTSPNKSVSFSIPRSADPDTGLDFVPAKIKSYSYTVTYDLPVKARVSNVQLIISRLTE